MKPNLIWLHLEFVRPTPGKAVIEFDLSKNVLLVDKIFQANAVYIQPSAFGAKVIDGIDKPKIVVEVKTSGAPFNWDSLCHKWVRKKLQRSGMSRSDAKLAAADIVLEARKFSRLPKTNSV